MTEIIPAILAKDFDEVKKKIRQVEDYTHWVQLDVADSDFVSSYAWGDPIALRAYDPGVFIEAHLMVAEPEKVIEDWIRSGVKRIYFHYEATSQHKAIVEKIQESELEAGIAILAETPASVLDPLIDSLDAVLLFAGDLGSYGGIFNEVATLPKIVSLRKARPDIIIEVDGGMNPKTAEQVVEAGANAVVAGSYIFGSKDIQKAIGELKDVMGGNTD